jgi:hypothetical protein
MVKSWRSVSVLVLVIVAVSAALLPTLRPAAYGRSDDASRGAGAAHYTVVETEGHNLLVTDNATNKLYFYTVDKDKPVGEPLKLRASVDLTKVGQPEIKITPHALEK